LALLGRNGLIINGTGDDHAKISRIKDKLEDLGYDTSMVMVNTADEISKQRNIERGQRGGRTVPEEIRKEKWDSVQASRPKFAEMFGDRYFEFDNSEDLRQAPPEVVKQKKDEMLQIFKSMQQFVAEPPSNESASLWIAHQIDTKDTLPVPKDGAEQMPHPESAASDEARKLGLQYYGFGRYGKDGKVTHRSVHDKLVQVEKMSEEVDLDAEFEQLFSEDLRNWFSKSHPKGDWVRMGTKGEIKGPCAREPGEGKPKCLPRQKAQSLSKKERASAVQAKRRKDPDADRQGKPIHVGLPSEKKKNISESYQLSGNDSLNMLLLGKSIEVVDFTEQAKPKDKYLTDKSGAPRVFLMRRTAAKEAHTKNGVVLTHKNGYIVKINEEINHVESPIQSIQEETTRSAARSFGEIRRTSARSDASTLGEGRTETKDQQTLISESKQETQTSGEENGRSKIRFSEVWRKKKEYQKVKESIDKGIEPGLSMASAGENPSRSSNAKTKMNKKPFEEAIGAGGEDIASRSDHEELKLKRQGIDLQTFKSRKPIV
jgi:hypothetical protein